MKPRTYRDPILQRAYVAMLDIADDASGELYIQAPGSRFDGDPRGGANIRCAFWDGVQDQAYGERHRGKMTPKLSIVWACYMAGRDWASENPGLAQGYAEKRSIRQELN